jgi:hypothetical protein
MWQGLSTGCFHVSKIGTVDCWGDSPIFYLLDFGFVLFMVVVLPFVVLGKGESTKDEAPEG